MKQELNDLVEVANLVLSEISDRDTGYFYQFKSKVQKAERALREEESKSNEDFKLEALKRSAKWLGRLIADGGHLNCVLPRDAVRTLDMVQKAIDDSKEGK